MNRTIWDVCTQHDISAGAANRTLQSAFLIMKKNRFRRMPITKIGKIQGILTVSDLLRAIIELGLPQAYHAKISNYMTRNPFTIHKGSSIKQAVALMAEKGFGSLIVVGDNPSKIQGIITERDILKISKDYLDLDTKLETVDPRLFVGNLKVEEESVDIHSAINSMLNSKVNRIIVTKNTIPLSLISAHDIIHLVTQEMEEILENENFLASLTIKFISSDKLHSVKPSSTIGDALNLMLKHSIGGLAIVENNKLKGIFTERTVLRLIDKKLS